ncbi:MAG: aminoacetone oxidase family FAD-binding enzyme [Clostridiales bacterium]|nr:aminoacetone oxidase family FAD-binding enzyme [Clostridiales bacterium]
MVKEVAVIGGGAGGIFASINLAKALGAENIILLERLNRIGKKLAVTGNGQGNITNKNLSNVNYYSYNDGFFNYAISNFTNKDLIAFFEELGLVTTVKDNKVYPLSKQASSVLDLMRYKLEDLNVEVKTEFFVSSVKKEKDYFLITNGNEVIKAKKVIFACGGKSSKQFGTDGKSYDLLKPFSHKLTKLTPALVQLKTEIKDIKGLHGLRIDALVKGFVNGKFVKETAGELLFTEYGVSGPVIFQLSGHLLKNDNAKIVVDFMPNFESDKIIEILKNKQLTAPYLTDEDLFTGIINKQIGKAVIKKANSNKIEDIVKTLKAFEIKVTGSLGFDYAQVTKGGVDTTDINEKTMESKLVKGLYIVGEMLDVDGDSGGYNLQWAFSSSYLAVKDILKCKD